MAGHELAAEADAPRTEYRFWLRTCNRAGPGELMGLLDATWCAQQNDVVGSLDTGLSWTVQPTQDPQQPPRTFTLTPLTDEQARDWIRANRCISTPDH